MPYQKENFPEHIKFINLNRFIGMQFSEKTKQLINSEISKQLGETKIDPKLSSFFNYRILMSSYGYPYVYSKNIFTALLVNGLYYPESIKSIDKFEVDSGEYILRSGSLHFKPFPLDKIRELKINKLFNNNNHNCYGY